jgi:hypothetical protein
MLLSVWFSLGDRHDEIVLFLRSNGQPAGWKNTLYPREKGDERQTVFPSLKQSGVAL